jgi:hypothetical protein
LIVAIMKESEDGAVAKSLFNLKTHVVPGLANTLCLIRLTMPLVTGELSQSADARPI